MYGGFYTHLTNPGTLIQLIFGSDSITYILKIFGPFLFLPFFHVPTLLFTFPVLLQNILSNNEVFRSFSYHYTTGLTPFVFLASISGFNVARNKIAWFGKRPVQLAVLLLFVSLLRSGPSEYFYFSDSLSHKTAHRDYIRGQFSHIPQPYSVLTHNNFIPRLVNRTEIYQFDYGGNPTKAASAKALNVDYVIFDQEFWEPGTLGVDETVAELKANGYTVDQAMNGFYIMKKI